MLRSHLIACSSPPRSRCLLTRRSTTPAPVSAQARSSTGSTPALTHGMHAHAALSAALRQRRQHCQAMRPWQRRCSAGAPCLVGRGTRTLRAPPDTKCNPQANLQAPQTPLARSGATHKTPPRLLKLLGVPGPRCTRAAPMAEGSSAAAVPGPSASCTATSPRTHSLAAGLASSKPGASNAPARTWHSTRAAQPFSCDRRRRA